MSPTGMVITFTTNADSADDFASLLARALPLVEGEAGTTAWIAARSADDPSTFYLVDTFSGPEGRDAHLAGEAAALILGEGSAMLAGPPAMSMTSVVAAKGA